MPVAWTCWVMLACAPAGRAGVEMGPTGAAAAPASSAPAPAAGGPASRPAGTVYRNPTRYNTFPDVQRLPDGRLLCVFRDAARAQPIKHIEPDARIVGCLSADHGLTWSEPFVIYDDPDCQNDPSLAVLRDGRLMLTFFNWSGLHADFVARYHPPFVRKVDRGAWGTYAEVTGVFLLEGTADPLAWQRRARRVAGGPSHMHATSSAILETVKGTLLLPIYGHGTQREADEAYVLRSTDGGKSWSPPILMATDPAGRIEMQEPALGQAANGDVVCLMRTANAEDHLYVTRSSDDGLTWSAPQRSPIIGHPADVDLLPDGRLLAVYGYRHAPFGVRACLSTDHGRTWDLSREIILTAGGQHGDLGYPSACLTGDGHVLVVWYMNAAGTNDRWIESRRIPLADLK
ncbi:MAG: exo-alpha-sialidase [Phycisphaerae bacterium]